MWNVVPGTASLTNSTNLLFEITALSYHVMKGHPIISPWGGRGKSVLRKEDVLPQAKAKLCFAFAQDPR
jgi:hypothetical protein